jgi:hypothetical protein
MGMAFWGCRACMSFAIKVNHQLQAAGERQDRAEEKWEQTTGVANNNKQRLDRMDEEMERLKLDLQREREE